MHRPRYRCAINADLWRDSKCWLKAQIFYGLAETKENHRNKKTKGKAVEMQEKYKRKTAENNREQQKIRRKAGESRRKQKETEKGRND